jgi:hypothetical protein
MKYRVVTENVVNLDWDNVQITKAGDDYLETNYETEQRCGYQRGETCDVDHRWEAFSENWLTEALLAAKEGTHVGNLYGTIWFGFDENDQPVVSTGRASWGIKTTLGYLGYTASEDVPLQEKAETFVEGME